LTGLALFAAVALLAEGVLWPAESRLKAAVAALEPATGPHSAAGPMDRDATTVARAAVAALVLLVAGFVVMVAQP
jgi:hypothetical protein